MWDDGQWGLQRPSLFESTGIVEELEGIDALQKLKSEKKSTIVYIYHPDDKASQQSVVEFEEFTKRLKMNKKMHNTMRTAAINVSLKRNRLKPEPSESAFGEKPGSFLPDFGEFSVTPTIKIFKAGSGKVFEGERTVDNLLAFAKGEDDESKAEKEKE